MIQFREEGSLGLHLDVWKEHELVEREDGKNESVEMERLVVGGCVPNSMAEEELDRLAIKEFVENSVVSHVNTVSTHGMTAREVVELLRDSPRPLRVRLRLHEDEHDKLYLQSLPPEYREREEMRRRLLEGEMKGEGEGEESKELGFVEVMFQEGMVGLQFKENRACGGAAIVVGFVRGEGGEVFQGEACAVIEKGMILAKVEGEVVFGQPLDSTVKLIGSLPRPLTLSFAPSPDSLVKLSSLPEGFGLADIEGYLMLTSPGKGGREKGLRPGMVLLRINKSNIKKGSKVEDIITLIQQSPPPIKLFMRDLDLYMKLINLQCDKMTIGRG